METITRQNGKVVNVSELTIPDLWHLAMHLRDLAQKHGGDSWYAVAAHDVLETWHLAHDLLNVVRDT